LHPFGLRHPNRILKFKFLPYSIVTDQKRSASISHSKKNVLHLFHFLPLKHQFLHPHFIIMDAPIDYKPKSLSLPRTSMWSAKEFVVDRTPSTFKIKAPPFVKENPSEPTKHHDVPKQSVSATIQELENQVQTILARIEELRQSSSISSSETSSSPEDHARNPDKLPPPSFSNQSYKNYPSFKEILGDFMPMERIDLKMDQLTCKSSQKKNACVSSLLTKQRSMQPSSKESTTSSEEPILSWEWEKS
jgi:hypothetical protein